MNVMNSSQPNSETGTATAAPVLDYACLFSHDLKRKQKRWQDGRLKFHCFNKRVMVYDERGNFIGDTHWTMDYDLDEGEEFQLARGCVVVQVSECLGRKEQDLSALIDQRYKDKEERKAHADAAAASKPYRPAPTPHRPPMPITQTMTTIATPRGNQLGRAILPTLSPFEQRNLDAQESAQRDEQARPAKRRKPEASPPSKSGYARSLFGAPLALSSFTSSAAHPSQTAPSRASDIRAIGREPLLPRSRPMPSLLKVQPTAFADTPSKAPKTTARSNPIIIADDTPETDSNHVHVDSAEPSVSLATIAGKSKARAGRSSNKPSHRDEHLAEEDGPPSSGEIIGARAVSPQLVAAESTLLQPRIAKRKTLLSVPRKQTGQPTHNQLESSTTARTDDQFSTADALDLNPRTSLVASTKRAKKRGLLIAAEKTTTRKRRRNVEDESGHDVAKSAYSVRAEEEEVVSEDKRRRKVSAGLMFDDDDVINVDSDATSREAAAIARMRESMTFASDEDEPAVIKQGLENGARRKEAGDEGRIQGQLRAREVRKEREEEDRQRQLRETQVQEESERKQREMEAREEAARQKRRQEKMALEEEKRRQEAREEEARQEELRRQQAREQETREKEARDEEVRRREAREDEARREALRQQQIREHEAREKQAREKQAREKQAREKQAREKQAREEELRRQEAREREAREAERRRLEAHEQELRRRKAREEELQQELIRERQAREREAKERRAREEEEQRQQELRQEQTREKEAQEREAKQKEEREREALAREVREREAREAEDRERKAREREARLEAREKEALEREARLEAREKESQLKEAREKEARAKQADAEKTRPKDVREKARLPKFVPPTRPSKLGGAVRASLSRAIPQAAGVRASTAARESTNLDAATRNRSAEEPTGPSSATLPVFTRANGGPWSIQAHDLLGIGRPS
ncbi:conserved hypothetical protein [Verticillium alfalfae VaMs.102]|uniref:5'-3' DNA helicase ZGRF1-like N-terminal domain-containing protein n=1 Tax=Verticillium alfalfae (strain VaMs.102 / ATCC MYA-4576 / FGSC 10136) TaxID=526221 RepID=C9SBT4_VERA1|nr:conserved hypothetical protein [Verticillium alfalfae VaMs.102]EEY15818.1 conserved hypothetical protein [Verticillium alfalfae VaMs.102]